VLYDSCHKPKKHINASKVYSDEREQREMFGHTGAEAYEMMRAKKSKLDTIPRARFTIIKRDGNLIAEDTGCVLADTFFLVDKNITGMATVKFDTLGNSTICYQPTSSDVGDSSISGKIKKQQHARKYHSYFYVFEKR